MSERTRLLHSSKNPATRRLLEASLRDAPPRSALPAVAAGLGAAVSLAPALAKAALSTSLGVEAGAAAGTTTVGATAASLAGGGGVAGAKVATASLAVLTAKWFAVGAVVTGAVSAGQHVLVPERQPAARATSTGTMPRFSETSAADVARRRAGMAPAVASTKTTPTVTTTSELPVAQVPVVPASPAMNAKESPSRPGTEVAGSALPVPAPAFVARESPSNAAPSAVGADSDGSLAREASWIDQARRALARHDATEAARALEGYDASRRVGVLDREALLLRVELSVVRGDVEGARRLAERYSATYPGDAHLPRLQALLARAGVGR